MPQIPFVGASYRERSSNLDAQVCINLMPVLGESGTAKAVRALIGTPGMRPLAQAAVGAVRALHNPSSGGDAIVVSGAAVYRMNTAFVLTQIGTIDAGTAPAIIADNGQQAMIVTGQNGYVVDLTTYTLTTIADEAFYGASAVDLLLTYLILNKPGSNVFYITGSNAVTFDALDFSSADSNAEPIVRHIVTHNSIFFLKRTVAEIWRPTTALDFPFARDTNASIEQGCAAPGSVVKMDNSVFWLGANESGGGIVWRLNGYTPQRVSTDAIEFAIAGYGNISDAIAYTYQQEGHTFYVLTFPNGDATWVYDAATQMWHQRAYLDPNTGKFGRHRSNCHMFFAGQHVVGDYANGQLYALDLDYVMDGTDPLVAVRAASHITGGDYQMVVHNRVQVDMEMGRAPASGQGAAPVALLDWSDDGGHTWSNQHAAPLGALGQYMARARWNRLGRSRDRVYRLTISDPVKRVILGASLNPEE
jgi:hypothetical protein